ncbi:MAG: hypothetical protein KAV87_40080, partial [Desulfobacteraceae bacterium]|nr:hypothetical protein [Desulfobacteraceae bacterium]
MLIEQLVDTLIRFFRTPRAGILSGVMLLGASFIPSVPSWMVEILRVFSGLFFGLVVHYKWQSRVIEEQRRKERDEVAERVVEEFTGLQRLGLRKILRERDSEKPGVRTFGFFERMEQFKPRKRVMIIGITLRALVDQFPTQIRKNFLDKNKELKLDICVLHPDSPCAHLRSGEFPPAEGVLTPQNIKKAIELWKGLKSEYLDRIVLKWSKAIPYGEYEIIDPDHGKSLIYFTPVTYKYHTDGTPSFLFESPGDLYKFHF